MFVYLPALACTYLLWQVYSHVLGKCHHAQHPLRERDTQKPKLAQTGPKCPYPALTCNYRLCILILCVVFLVFWFRSGNGHSSGFAIRKISLRTWMAEFKDKSCFIPIFGDHSFKTTPWVHSSFGCPDHCAPNFQALALRPKNQISFCAWQRTQHRAFFTCSYTEFGENELSILGLDSTVCSFAPNLPAFIELEINFISKKLTWIFLHEST